MRKSLRVEAACRLCDADRSFVIEGEAPAWSAAERGLRVEAAGAGRSRLIITGVDAGPIQPLIDRLRGDGTTIVSVRPVRETLEDLFMRAVTDPQTGKVLAPGASADNEDAGDTQS